MKDPTGAVLRYYIGLEKPKAQFAQLCRFLDKTGICRVILFSAPFAGASSFFPLSYYEKHAAMLAPLADELRARGVEVGVNVLYTIGHCYFADDGAFPFRRAVGSDGLPSRGCACIRDGELLAYIEKVYRLYAALRPSVVFVDDDVRAVSLGQFTCFCPDHVAAVGERVGRPVTREEIVASLSSPLAERDPVKGAYFGVWEKDRDALFSRIAAAVHGVSPETEIGTMADSYPAVTLGWDLSRFFRDHREEKVRRIRPHMNFYREGALKDIPQEFIMPDIERNLIGDPSVELQPEIENDTYGRLNKSVTLTDLQTAWCLAHGFRNPQYNLFDFALAHADNFREITEGIARRAPVYAALCAAVPEGTRSHGIYQPASPQAMLHREGRGGDVLYTSPWYGWLQLLGLPLGFDRNDARFVLLSGNEIAAESAEEIDRLLSGGAVLDARAADSLVRLGYGARIGIREILPVTGCFAGERFTSHPLNGKWHGATHSHYFDDVLIGKDRVRDVRYLAGAKPLSHIVDRTGKKVASGVTVYENARGERFAVLPFDYNIFSQFTAVTPRRKEQLCNVFAWIAREPLPLVAEGELVTAHVNEGERENLLFLTNLSTDPQKPAFRYRVRGELLLLNEKGGLLPAKYREKDGVIRLSRLLPCANYVVLVDRF